MVLHKEKLDLGFCFVTYCPKDKTFAREIKLLKKAFEENYKFFLSKILKFNVELVYSRKEFNELWKNQTEDFVSAFARKNKIVIFSLEVFEKETRWKKNKFYEALVHEINHLFYECLTNLEYYPIWLSEGLATFFQHSKRKHRYKKRVIISCKALNDNSDEMSLEKYQIYSQFVEYLIINFGEDKILITIKELRKNKKINIILKEVYNKTIEELVENANKYHKNII